MEKRLKKVAKERLADMIQNIIKKMSKEQIGVAINAEMKQLNPKFRDPTTIQKLYFYTCYKRLYLSINY